MPSPTRCQQSVGGRRLRRSGGSLVFLARINECPEASHGDFEAVEVKVADRRGIGLVRVGDTIVAPKEAAPGDEVTLTAAHGAARQTPGARGQTAGLAPALLAAAGSAVRCQFIGWTREGDAVAVLGWITGSRGCAAFDIALR